MSAGQSSLVQCLFTVDENMEQRLLCHVPTKLAIGLGTFLLPSQVREDRQHAYAAIHSKFQDTMRKVPHVRLPHDAFSLSLQQNKEVSLHSIPTDASSTCFILLFLKISPNLLPDG
jgi:hypothetical protein